ncbi:MAG: phosphoadenylyl-sulfate reductase [Methylobacteriaceae bacterium]|nr:phosphoadenylyl-sulfate reductase [Methylobacteriaceae bacterium]
MSVHDVRLFGDQIAASRLEARFSAVRATSLLRLAIEDLFAGKIALVSSFGADSAVLLHMISQIDARTPVVFVDTGQMFPETLAYRDTLVSRFGLADVRSVTPDPGRLSAEDPEAFLWSHDPDRCCDIRKVAPLAAALEGFDAWITGRKRHQAATRAALSLFEAEGDRVKVNPLAGWSASEVIAYLRSHEIHPHPLVAKGFLSIGCLPCTSRVAPGEDPRAGRWRGRGKVECGIHAGTLDAGSDI